MFKKIRINKKNILIPIFIFFTSIGLGFISPPQASAANTPYSGTCKSTDTATTTYTLDLSKATITRKVVGWQTVTTAYPVTTSCEYKTTNYIFTESGSLTYHAPSGDASTITLHSTPKVNQTISDATLAEYTIGTTNLVAYKTITVNVGSAAATSNSSTTTNPDQPITSCNLPGMGWIICPIFDFLSSIASAGTESITNLLSIKPELFSNNGTDNPTFIVWTRFRDVANIGLVVVFTIIIFSQLTSLGISNYGVKKMLPRLIISAILINVSYYVVQAAVDISNILGSSLKDGLSITVPLPEGTPAATWVTVLSAAGVAGVAVGTAVIWGAVGTLGPVLLAAVLAVVMIFVILVARQAIVILLVVISPVAFLAYLLPNTEKGFSFWRKTLTSMLLLYPLAGLLFGVSKLASDILLSIGASTGDVFQQILAVGVGIVPMFALPFLLKNSLNAIPVIGNMASKLQGRANANIGKNLKSSYQKSDFSRARAAKTQIRDARRNQAYAGRAAAGGFRGFLAGGGIASRDTKERIKSAAIAAQDKAEEDSISQSASVLSRMGPGGTSLTPDQYRDIAMGKDVQIKDNNGNLRTVQAKSFTSNQRIAATREYMKSARADEVMQFAQHASMVTDSRERKYLAQAIGGSSAASKSTILGGSTVGAIEAGSASGIDFKSMARDNIGKGKVTAEALSTMDQAESSLYLDAAQSTPMGSTERQMLIDAHASFMAAPNLRGKVAQGSQHAMNIDAMRSL